MSKITTSSSSTLGTIIFPRGGATIAVQLHYLGEDKDPLTLTDHWLPTEETSVPVGVRIPFNIPPIVELFVAQKDKAQVPRAARLITSLERLLAQRPAWRRRLSPKQPELAVLFRLVDEKKMTPGAMLTSLETLRRLNAYTPYLINVAPMKTLRAAYVLATAHPKPISPPLMLRTDDAMTADKDTVFHLDKDTRVSVIQDARIMPRRRILYRERMPADLWALCEPRVPAMLPANSTLYMALWKHARAFLVPAEFTVIAPSEIPTLRAPTSSGDIDEEGGAQPSEEVIRAETAIHYASSSVLVLIGGFDLAPQEKDMARGLPLISETMRGALHVAAARALDGWTRPNTGVGGDNFI